MTNNDNIIVLHQCQGTGLGDVRSHEQARCVVDGGGRRSSRLSSSVLHCIAVKIAAWCHSVMCFV